MQEHGWTIVVARLARPGRDMRKLRWFPQVFAQRHDVQGPKQNRSLTGINGRHFVHGRVHYNRKLFFRRHVDDGTMLRYCRLLREGKPCLPISEHSASGC